MMLAKIYSDGATMLIQDQRGIYVIKDPVLKSFVLNIRQDAIEYTSFGGGLEMVPGPRTIELDFSMIGGVAEYWAEGDPRAVILQSYSVMELLQNINQKLKERKV